MTISVDFVLCKYIFSSTNFHTMRIYKQKPCTKYNPYIKNIQPNNWYIPQDLSPIGPNFKLKRLSRRPIWPKTCASLILSGSTNFILSFLFSFVYYPVEWSWFLFLCWNSKYSVPTLLLCFCSNIYLVKDIKSLIVLSSRLWYNNTIFFF